MLRRQYLRDFLAFFLVISATTCLCGDFNEYVVERGHLYVRHPLTLGQRVLPSFGPGLGLGLLCTLALFITDKVTPKSRHLPMLAISAAGFTSLFYFFGNLNMVITEDDGSWWGKGEMSPGLDRFIICSLVGVLLD